MNASEAVGALDALNEDAETDHLAADKILLAAAPPEVAEAWRRARDRHLGGWWYS